MVVESCSLITPTPLSSWLAGMAQIARFISGSILCVNGLLILSDLAIQAPTEEYL